VEIIKRIFRPKKTANLVVYALTAIVDGDAKATPLGKAPRFARSYEEAIKRKHRPAESSFISEQIGTNAVILFWTNDGVDAVSFLSREEAESFPGYSALPPDVLSELDTHLRHFPRQESAGR